MYDMDKDPNDYFDLAFKMENVSTNDSQKEKVNVNEQKEQNDIKSSINNQEEEEAKSKLIAHYSKLLPWIYYVLN